MACRYIKNMDTYSAKIDKVPEGFIKIMNAKKGVTELEAFKEHVRMHEAAAKMYTAKLFREADLDKNGVLSFDEYFTHRVKSKQFAGLKRDTLKVEFDNIDTDKSGELDQAEFNVF